MFSYRLKPSKTQQAPFARYAGSARFVYNYGLAQMKQALAISDAGWRTYLDYLAYKCDWLGKHFVKIDRFFPSSKLCSSCGATQEMPLSRRRFECTTCNASLDRDFNASINIRAAGLSVLKACGEMGIGSLDEARITGF